MSLKVVLGPMYAGKSTYIISTYRKHLHKNRKILVVNYIGDTRYTDVVNAVISHSNDKIKATAVENLVELLNLDDYNNSEVLFIDEANMYNDLVDFVDIAVNKHKKKLTVCGLSGDHQMRPFGEVLDIIPMADDVLFLHGFCQYCDSASSFTQRTSDAKMQKLIGAEGDYVSVCRDCYLTKTE